MNGTIRLPCKNVKARVEVCTRTLESWAWSDDVYVSNCVCVLEMLTEGKCCCYKSQCWQRDLVSLAGCWSRWKRWKHFYRMPFASSKEQKVGILFLIYSLNWCAWTHGLDIHIIIWTNEILLFTFVAFARHLSKNARCWTGTMVLLDELCPSSCGRKGISNKWGTKKLVRDQQWNVVRWCWQEKLTSKTVYSLIRTTIYIEHAAIDYY